MHVEMTVASLWLCSVSGDPTWVEHKPPAQLQTLHNTSETQTPRAHSALSYSDSSLTQQKAQRGNP